jgi:DNA-binding transcriptional LysR family regulator
MYVIHHMNNDQMDLNLLRPLSALLQERHVSRAAELVNLSQPAMSNALARLRRAFGDELLVRSAQGYQLTPRAERLRQELAAVLPRLDMLLTDQPFDPAAAARTFRLTGTGTIATTLGLTLFRTISALSPGSRLELLAWHGQATDDLGRGLTDLVFRTMAPPAALRSEHLLRERFVCVVSADHPLADRDRLSLEDYLRYQHVAVNLSDGQQPSIDHRLQAMTKRRPVSLQVPYDAMALAAVPGTQLIATLPAPLAVTSAEHHRLRIIGAPPEIEPIDWVMIWHPRTDDDPAHQWLRQQVREVAAGIH